METIAEADWKKFRAIGAIALERYCSKVLGEVASLASSESGTAHERYLALWELIRDRDESLALAFNDHRRSNAFLKIATMRSRDMLTDDELESFSPATRAVIELFLS